MVLPEPFTTTTPIIASFDFFDFAAGAGYKKFYLAGIRDSVGDKFILTTDGTLNASSGNFKLDTGTLTADFDIQFNNALTIVNGEATIDYVSGMEGGNTGTLDTVWVVSHVRGATVTPIGTVSSWRRGNAGFHQQTLKVTLTEKYFSPGDILRITPTSTYVPGGTGTGYSITLDPAGTVSRSINDTSQTSSSSSSINIPFNLNQ